MSRYEAAAKRAAEMNLLGLPMNQVGVPEVLDFFEAVIRRNQKAIALNLNVYCVTLALKHAWLHQFINEAHLVYCDGDGVRMGLQILGYPPPPKITYNVWIWQIAEFCERKGFSIFLLGAKPGVAEEAKSRLLKRYPGLKVGGTHHGYFEKSGNENQAVIQEINSLKPDILLVCFGMPEQEKWILDHWKNLDTHILIKGGAALDYASGRLKRAPAWMIRLHLEWFFRLLQEPRRLFKRYVFGNTYFLFQVLMQKFRIKKSWSSS